MSEANGPRVGRAPVDPGPSRWHLPPPPYAEDDLIAVGADLEPATILAAYAAGFFPMGVGRHGREPLGWWSPQHRGVLLPGGFHTSRSLRRTLRSFTVTFDNAFEEVVAGCADPRRAGRWITPQVAAAYGRLHRLGWAHSVEVWRDGRLVGGLYGLAVGGLFAGESMFHRATDASKAALAALTRAWFADGDPRRLVDVQWTTAHLASLGVVEIDRADYLDRLAGALAVPWTPLPEVLLPQAPWPEVTETSHLGQGGTNVSPQVPPT